MEFCSGTPGLIPVACLAMQLFPDQMEELFEMAQQVAEVTWQKGLIIKGTGLCHGIAGNAYILHSMYKTFIKIAKTTVE